MPADHHEISVVTYVTEKLFGGLMQSEPVLGYAHWVEGLAKSGQTGKAAFFGWGSFVSEGHVAIPDHAVMATFALLVLVIGIPLMKKAMSIERPGDGQQVLELVVQAIRDMLDDVIGHHSHQYLPIVGAFAVFIFVCNFLGMLPGFTAPTANLNTTLALGLVSFLYYNLQGIKAQGLGKYLAHFMGPVAMIAPLMIIIEIFSHMFRPVSLAIRLYGNMNGEHILGGVFLNDLGSYPLLFPVPVMALGLFVVFLQSYIFIMLSMVYIAGAVAHDEH